MENLNPQTQPHLQQTIVVVEKQKSVGLAFILAFLFGPLGLLYASIVGGILMFFITIAIGIVTFGFGLVIPWIICIFWAVIAASLKKDKVYSKTVTNGYSQKTENPQAGFLTKINIDNKNVAIVAGVILLFAAAAIFYTKNQKANSKENLIIGTWILSDLDDGKPVSEKEKEERLKILEENKSYTTFYEDGKMTFFSEDKKEKANTYPYKIIDNGKHLMVEERDKGVTEVMEILELTSNRLVLKRPEADKNFVYLKTGDDKSPTTTRKTKTIEDEINEILNERISDNQWVVKTDQNATWTEYDFKEFINPERKTSPFYPYIALGDFDGDYKRNDYAVTVINKKNHKQRIMFILNKKDILMYDNDASNAAISLCDRQKITDLDNKETNMKVDGVGVVHFEASSYVLYLDNKVFKEIWTSD